MHMNYFLPKSLKTISLKNKKYVQRGLGMDSIEDMKLHLGSLEDFKNEYTEK